jgi:thiol-disulfide isomerase/thioredoxin
MKKNILLIVTVILASIALILSLYTFKDKVIKDNIKFKNEYESLNGKLNSHDKEYVKVELDDDNPYVYATYDEVMDILKNKTGVIYFGFPECPWCRNMVPVLADAAKELGIEKIYYFNALDMRDIKSLDEDGNIVIEKEGTKEYYELIEALGDSIGSYEGLNNDSIKRLYFPTVVFVKDGKILNAHIGTLDSQEDPYVVLNKNQKNELKNIYIDNINKVYDILCDEAC